MHRRPFQLDNIHCSDYPPGGVTLVEDDCAVWLNTTDDIVNITLYRMFKNI